MKIAILGGGLTGLTAAYNLAKTKKHEITLFESAPTLGGLASGFRGEGWDWSLERTYHHIFSSDSDILGFLKEIGYEGIFFGRPITSSLYTENADFKIYAVDTPLDLLLFSKISLIDRIRAGMTLAALKLSPFIPLFDQTTTESLMVRTMGKRAYEVLFGWMLRKKYGKYAGNILASFIWSRIHKRTKSLGYMDGGFQCMVDFVAKECVQLGVTIETSATVAQLEKKSGGYVVQTHKGDVVQSHIFDLVISTLPSSILAKVGTKILSAEEIQKLRALKHLSATNLILEMEESVIDKEYWVSLCTDEIPGLVFVQHTNFIDKSHYNHHHILYIGNYCEDESPLMSMTKEEMFEYYKPHLQRLLKKEPKILNSFLWKTNNAQPIFDRDFLLNVPHFETSSPRFYIANLDMTYPYDRGTNYAVKLGREVVKIVMQIELSHGHVE